MRGIKRRDTTPELALRSELHRRGFRFKVDRPIAVEGGRPVRPDVVFSRQRLAVFVDGCFWHGCPKHAAVPAKNADYWGLKIARNIERDGEQDSRLKNAGWTVVRIWEHVDFRQAADAVEKRLRT